MTAASPLPQRIRMEGSYVIVEPLDPAKHAASLWEAVKGPENDALWQYLSTAIATPPLSIRSPEVRHRRPMPAPLSTR
jgi:hypothetical protein